MPLQLEIKKKLHTRTDRVKAVDFHASLPWLLVALYSGHLVIYNWEEQSTVRTVEASPNCTVRCARFIERKQWVVCGSDDMCVRVFSYNSLEKVRQFEAHMDFIRHIAVHPTLPLLLTSSDDMTVRCWDWSRNWQRVASFEGHMHYVMMAMWHPSDPQIFASASLDRSIKVWAVGAAITSGKGSVAAAVITQPHISLVGHEAGVNCIAYSRAGDKPYVVSGGDDCKVRVWDYQTKHCVSTLTGHNGPILSIVYHPTLPLILSGGDDGTVVLWHSGTFRKEMVLTYNMGRVWGLAVDLNSNAVALGTDEGTVAVKLGTERAVASMHAGKVVYARASEVFATNLRQVNNWETLEDGEKISAGFREVGQCELFAQQISHHPNGRLLAICGDGEYVVYMAQALRSKAFGRATHFIWSAQGDYAVREETNRIVVFRQFEELTSIVPPFPVDELFGHGPLLGLRSTEFICFYTWNELRLVRRIDVVPRGVYWNDSGTEVILTCQDAFYALRYDADAVAATAGENATTDGVEDSFEFFRDANETVESGCWVSGCFLYTTPRLRLQSFTAGAVDTVGFLEAPAWLLGFVVEMGRLVLVDRNHNLTSFRFFLPYAQYMSAIARREFDLAAQTFQHVPKETHTKLARFLETQGHKETALQVTADIEHKFELALSLGKLEMCTVVLQQMSAAGGSAAAVIASHWTRLGDAAMEKGALPLATACYTHSGDTDGLMLIAVSTGDEKLLRRVAELAKERGKINLAVTCLILLREVEACVELLLNSGRVPEAALFARTYLPERCGSVVDLWKGKLNEAGRTDVAAALADFPFAETATN